VPGERRVACGQRGGLVTRAAANPFD